MAGLSSVMVPARVQMRFLVQRLQLSSYTAGSGDNHQQRCVAACVAAILSAPTHPLPLPMRPLHRSWSCIAACMQVAACSKLHWATLHWEWRGLKQYHSVLQDKASLADSKLKNIGWNLREPGGSSKPKTKNSTRPKSEGREYPTEAGQH